MRNLVLTVALLATLGVIAEAFQTVPPPSRRPLGFHLSSGRARWSRQKPTFVLSAIEESDDKDPSQPQPRGSRAHRLRRRLRRLVSKLSLRKKMVAAVMFGAVTAGLWNAATPQRADASAPVMAVPKAQRATPEKEALLNQERKMAAQQQAEMQMVTQKASAIEREQGVEARVKFEKEYKAQKEKEAQEKAEGLEQLKRDLLDQGIDPFVDLEGQRQVILYEKGVDLGKVPGTLMYLEQQLQTGRTPQKSNAYKQAPNRRVIKAMVQDMKNKGIDPLAYFEAHNDKTQDILAMPPMAAAQMAAQYEANLEEYGQVNVPKEGEMSVLEKRKLDGGDKKQDAEAKKKAKEEQKRAKAEAKAKAAAEKKRAKEEAKAAKAAAKKEKAASKAAATAAAAAAATVASGTSSSALSATAAAIDSVSLEAPPSDEAEIVDQSSETEVEEPEVQAASVEAPAKSSNKVNIGGKEIGIIPLAGLGIVAAGGGTYGFRMYQEKAAVAEEERQRQFRILMGEESGPSSAPALEVVDTDDDLDFDFSPKVEEPTTKPSPAPQAPAKKKKRRGFFGKKNKNNRETDLTVLVSPGAKAPQFATLLAKILTYGAPGRFPSVEALPGEMPFEEFNLEAAQQQLLDARREAGIEVEDSAEIFANVVNCMLIDMVDLASSTLKSKDDKMTVEGIKVVVDFMNHAASLFESVAEDVVIEPVTYGGDLSRGKLEQMYAAYAGSGMMDMSALLGGDGGNDDFQAGVGLLQDVFDISDKKAEGLTMKIARKSMMEMMKDGKGMEEMMKQFGGEEGLAGMAGMEGMEGLMGGDPGDIDPEQLKMMLTSIKEMKDSGAFGPEDLKEVRNQFKEAYGSSIDEVMKEGGSDEDQELLELVKSILE